MLPCCELPGAFVSILYAVRLPSPLHASSDKPFRACSLSFTCRTRSNRVFPCVLLAVQRLFPHLHASSNRCFRVKWMRVCVVEGGQAVRPARSEL
eukprot:4463201-Alexandrium_andersonii.AAC.2